VNFLSGRLISVFVGIFFAAVTPSARALDNVSLQLRWDHQFQFAGYYAANWLGFYREAGLNVDIRSAVAPTGKTLSAIDEVVSGRADFGIGSADILIAHDEGARLAVTAVIFQQSPIAVFAREDTKLSTPADLTRLRVQRIIGETTDAEFQAMLRAEGINPTMVPPVSLEGWQGRSFDHLKDGHIDAYTGFTLTALWRAKSNNMALRVMRTNTYGVDFYGDSLFTSERLIESDPNLVERFVTASVKGWRYALSHPAEIAERIAKELKRTFPVEDPLEFNLFQSHEVLNLSLFPIVEVGHDNPRRWLNMHGALKHAGLVSGDLDVNRFVFDPELLRRERREFLRELTHIAIAIISIVAGGSIVFIVVLRRTVRRRTEQLRDSATRHRQAARIAFLGHWVWDETKNAMVSCSEEFADILGISVDECLTLFTDAKAPLEFVHPEDRDRFTRISRQYHTDLRTRPHDVEPLDIEFRVVRSDGTVRQVRQMGEPLLDDSGRAIRSIGTLQDISERKRIEGELEKALFTLDHTGDAAIVFSDNGKIVYANDTTSKLLGYTPEELRELHINDFDHAASLEDFERALVRLKTVGPYVFETVHMTKTGEAIPVEVSLSLLRMSGEDMMISISRDITERKRSEQALRDSQARLKEIFAIAPEAVITVGGDLDIQLFNKGAERIFGYRADEVLGESMDVLIPARLHDSHREHIAQFERSGNTYRMMDERNTILGVRKDGSEFPASASVSKLEVNGEKLFTVLLLDITERKRVEEERQRALTEAEQANQAKSQFLAAMSHELRTPLNAILGFAEIISRQHLGPIGEKKYAEYAKDIHDSGEHLLSLVNDLLDISTIEAGKASLTREMLPSQEIVADSLHFIAGEAERKGVTVSARFSDTPPTVFADRRAIRQVLLNLLTNAIKHTPKGGNILVSVSDAKQEALIRVTDTGTGIPADRLVDLTKPFFRLEQDPHKPVDGWGLGLAITKSLVELHDGQLSIESEVGSGTTVSVIIPTTAPQPSMALLPNL
jgi:PAS domain S-box-containing protein